jgi:hypothetical protein
MDPLIDFYLLRQAEVKRAGGEVEQEQMAFESACTLLRDPILDGSNERRLFVQQTGFPPLVIGFYRGVVEVARERAAKRLFVVPAVRVPARTKLYELTDSQNHELKQLLAAYPLYFCRENNELVWQPERPMLTEEFDMLVAPNGCARTLAFFIEQLQSRSRPTLEGVWG